MEKNLTPSEFLAWIEQTQKLTVETEEYVEPESEPEPESRPEASADPGPFLAAEDIDENTYDVSSDKGPLPFKTAADFALYFCDEFELSVWQIEELERLSGAVAPGRSDVRVVPTAENPMLYNMVATNGSGKDNVIIAFFTLWFLSCKMRSRVIVTSHTAQQVEEQTYKHCKHYGEKVNERMGEKIFDIVHCKLGCKRTGSLCKMFVTNEASRAEGFHAQGSNEFALIINEAKSIEDHLFKGFTRYSRWNYWIQVSSAGMREGVFYKTVTQPGVIQYPAPLELGKDYVRYIRIKDCPWLNSAARLGKVALLFGESSDVYRSIKDSEFVTSDGIYVMVRYSVTEYENPKECDLGLPPICGVDLSLGGDETVVSIWRGNYRVAQECITERYEPTLHRMLIAIFEKYELLAEQIAIDAGGLGKPIVQRLWDAGWEVHSFNFNAAARDKRFSTNRSAELWTFVKRLVENKYLVLPRHDSKFMTQLTSRRWFWDNGRTRLESKEDVRGRGGESPDRADAMVVAFSLLNFDTFVQALQTITPVAPRVVTIEDLQRGLDARRLKDQEGPKQVSEFAGIIKTAAFQDFIQKHRRRRLL